MIHTQHAKQCYNPAYRGLCQGQGTIAKQSDTVLSLLIEYGVEQFLSSSYPQKGSQNNPPPFMKPEGSLPSPQQLATKAYSKPEKYKPPVLIRQIQDPFSFYPAIHALVSKVLFSSIFPTIFW